MKRTQSLVCRSEIDDMLFEIPIQNGSDPKLTIGLGSH